MKFLHRSYLSIILFLVAFTQAEAANQTKPFKYELAICAIFRDEAPYLEEWIEFHRLAGVEHFFLYNHFSEDHYKEVLQPYINKGIVDLVDWPYPITNERRWSFIQTDAYNNAIAKYQSVARWIAFIDTDEFLFATEYDNLVDFLKGYEKFGGVGVNWQTFGTSQVAKIPDDQLLIETLIYKAPEDYSANIHVKSIVNPRCVAKFGSAHHAEYKEGYYSVDAKKQLFKGPFSPTIDVSAIRINHYWTRDEDFFYNCKIASRRKRGWSVEGDLKMASLLNEVVDVEIARFVPLLKERMAKKKRAACGL